MILSLCDGNGNCDDIGHYSDLYGSIIVPATGQLRWIRAGHDPAFIYDAQDNRFQELMGTGMALGVDPGYDFEEL
mgnify:CR=1 FL=1